VTETTDHACLGCADLSGGIVGLDLVPGLSLGLGSDFVPADRAALVEFGAGLLGFLGQSTKLTSERQDFDHGRAGRGSGASAATPWLTPAERSNSHAPIRVGVVGAHHSFVVGEGLLEERDRLGHAPRRLVGGREVIPRCEGAGVVGAQQPLAVGESLLEERDRLGHAPRRPVGQREVVPRHQGAGMVGAQHPLEAAYGPDHPTVATALNNLAEALRGLGHPDQAQPLYERALAIDEAAYGPDHPTVAIILNNLAEALRGLGHPDQAQPLYERALAIDEAAHGPDHPEVAATLNNLAGALRDLGHPDQAQPLLERALAIDEAAHGPDHPDVATDLNNLAAALRDLGHPDQAQPLLERAATIQRGGRSQVDRTST
jgi:hypothetical protein